ncbi:MAG: hypothetical protein AAF639_08075 [Chloroflexota bacterium]
MQRSATPLRTTSYPYQNTKFMKDTIDWLRSCRTGAEVLSLLRLVRRKSTEFELLSGILSEVQPSPVPNALSTPCHRCWLYPPQPGSEYCAMCHDIRHGTLRTGKEARRSLVVWGYVSFLPHPLREGNQFQDAHILASYVQDDNHFIVMIYNHHLQAFLQELALYHGTELKGYLQIFPSMGPKSDNLGIGDILCSVMQKESYYPLDLLRIRFYTNPYDVLEDDGEDDGIDPYSDLHVANALTFEFSEFLRLLETAFILGTILNSDDRQLLFDLLNATDETEQTFYWGRFMRILDQRGRDLVGAWNMRQWPQYQIHFLYELMNYVDYRPTN